MDLDPMDLDLIAPETLEAGPVEAGDDTSGSPVEPLVEDDVRPAEALRPSLDDRGLYLNRELSWLRFNARVLEEALDADTPLLERIKFLAIFAGNIDEFFMIRVAGLRHQMNAGALKPPPDGMTPAEQLAAIRGSLLPTLGQAQACWQDDLKPALWHEGIKILTFDELKNKQRKLLRRHFRSEILPVLTPLAFDPGHPFPHISNLSLNLAVIVGDDHHPERFARLKVPTVFPRLLRIPSEEKADSYTKLGLAEPGSSTFVWIEDVIAANLDLLFPGLEISTVAAFRVTRNADLEIEEDEASDLLSAMQEVVGQRHFGFTVRLEIDHRMPERIRQILMRNLGLQPYQVYTVDGPLGLAGLLELTRLDRPELKDGPFLPHLPPAFSGEEDLLDVIRRQDLMLYHPYDSFSLVVDLIRSAAADPDVLAIKQTLYRVGANSPIVQALMEARENGKQVAVLVELKARFDEANNIGWARALERAGVHVVYGVIGLKTHAKMCLIVRREADGIRRYVHLGTGNYNPHTASVYSDLGLFTCDPALATDVTDLFNALTGYSMKAEYQRLLVAPEAMREAILGRIEREIEVHTASGGGHLIFKMNSLVDAACIRALYRASQAGVRIDLQVRGICCLRPGVPGVSETITVTSIVGRFLEHTRVYFFHNGGDEEILLGSADLMPRNLDGRVEVLFPVDDPWLRDRLRDAILLVHLEDTTHARIMHPDGTYHRLRGRGPGPDLDSQAWMLTHQGDWHRDS
jgi:polyphosphate kinase